MFLKFSGEVYYFFFDHIRQNPLPDLHQSEVHPWNLIYEFRDPLLKVEAALLEGCQQLIHLIFWLGLEEGVDVINVEVLFDVSDIPRVWGFLVLTDDDSIAVLAGLVHIKHLVILCEIYGGTLVYVQLVVHTFLCSLEFWWRALA